MSRSVYHYRLLQLQGLLREIKVVCAHQAVTSFDDSRWHPALKELSTLADSLDGLVECARRAQARRATLYERHGGAGGELAVRAARVAALRRKQDPLRPDFSGAGLSCGTTVDFCYSYFNALSYAELAQMLRRVRDASLLVSPDADDNAATVTPCLHILVRQPDGELVPATSAAARFLQVSLLGCCWCVEGHARSLSVSSVSSVSSAASASSGKSLQLTAAATSVVTSRFMNVGVLEHVIKLKNCKTDVQLFEKRADKWAVLLATMELLEEVIIKMEIENEMLFAGLNC